MLAYSQGTVRVIPTVGKNFLQPTFLVALGLSFVVTSVSMVSFLASDAVEIVEFSFSASVLIGAVLAVSTVLAVAFLLAMRFLAVRALRLAL